MGKLRRKMTDVTVMLGPRIWRQKSLGDIWERVWTSAVEALNSSPRGQIWGTKDQPNLEGREEELFFVGNQFSSVQFSSVQSFSRVWLWPHGLQHTRLPCPSPTPKAYSNSHPSSQWYHLTISSSVIPFSSCPQSFPGSGSFQMSQLFASGGQNIRVSASTSVSPMNTQDWSPLGWTGWIYL